MYQGVTYSQHPKSELAWFSDDSLLFHFQTVHYSNNVFECLKAEQVQGQMRQNVQILDIIVRFELLRPKPNNFVWILENWAQKYSVWAQIANNQTFQFWTDFLEILKLKHLKSKCAKSKLSNVLIRHFPARFQTFGFRHSTVIYFWLKNYIGATINES